MIYRLRDMIYGKSRMIYLLRKHDIISVPFMCEAYIICGADIMPPGISSVSEGNGYHCKNPDLSARQIRIFTWRSGWDLPVGHKLRIPSQNAVIKRKTLLRRIFLFMAEWVGFTLSGINFESLPKMLSETKRPPLREDLFISGGVGGIRTHVPVLPTN